MKRALAGLLVAVSLAACGGVTKPTISSAYRKTLNQRVDKANQQIDRYNYCLNKYPDTDSMTVEETVRQLKLRNHCNGLKGY